MAQESNEAISAALNEAALAQVTGKKFYSSKTFWVNVIMGVALIIQTKFGFVIGPELQALAITAINLGLRKVTSEPLIW